MKIEDLRKAVSSATRSLEAEVARLRGLKVEDIAEQNRERARLRRKALRDAAGDICDRCRARGIRNILHGPNEAGNFWHPAREGTHRCPASAIWYRLERERGAQPILPEVRTE